MKLIEDQMVQLLYAYWVQTNISDNIPSNIEAIAYLFILTLIIIRIKVKSLQIQSLLLISQSGHQLLKYYYYYILSRSQQHPSMLAGIIIIFLHCYLLSANVFKFSMLIKK